MAKEMIELTSERDTVTGTTPYQFRPFIRVNRRLCVRVLDYPVRPGHLLLALLALAGVAYAAARWLLSASGEGN